MKVLVIDDSNFQSNQTVKLLKEAGFETCRAGNGQEGLQAVEKEAPDAVLCDLLMPEMDGFGFLENMKKNNSPLKVVIVSSNTQKGAKERCEDLGAAAFINKPLTTEKVTELLKPLFAEIKEKSA